MTTEYDKNVLAKRQISSEISVLKFLPFWEYPIRINFLKTILHNGFGWVSLPFLILFLLKCIYLSICIYIDRQPLDNREHFPPKSVI